MRTFLLALVFAFANAGAAVEDSGIEVQFTLFAEGFTAPLAIVEAPDGSDRFFVVDQPGQIWIVDASGSVLAEPFLDISDRILDLEPNYDERGLLGLAFHPDYQNTGLFFVYYSAEAAESAPDDWDHTSHVSRFTVSDDPDRADPDSEQLVMAIDQPYHNHNAGQIAFGPDGYLYIPLGDGGNGGDIDAAGDDRGRPDAGWAQTPDSFLGSILRIDIDTASPYAIPADNPFIDVEEVADEVFAYGFRNPYGMSFDLETGHLYVADAGQALWEEVNQVVAGGNYGWNIREGTHCFDPDNFLVSPPSCPDTGPLGEPLIDPVIEYRRSPEVGSVIIPGVLSRDANVPSLDGRFVFGDYASIRFIPTAVLYAATPREDGLWPMGEVSVRPDPNRPRGGVDRFLLGINQDLSGGLYALTTERGGPEGNTGTIYSLEDPTGPNPNLLTGGLIIVAAVVVVAAITVGILGRGGFRSGVPP